MEYEKIALHFSPVHLWFDNPNPTGAQYYILLGFSRLRLGHVRLRFAFFHKSGLNSSAPLPTEVEHNRSAISPIQFSIATAASAQ